MKNACCACRSNWQSITIIDELGFVPLSKTGAELLFEVFSQRYERGSILVTSNLPFDEWTEIFGSERLTGALLDRLTHHVHILEMNGESYRLNQSQNGGNPQKYLLIPTVIDQNPCAHLRMPRDMIFHGWSMRLFQAWQHSATMSS